MPCLLTPGGKKEEGRSLVVVLCTLRILHQVKILLTRQVLEDLDFGGWWKHIGVIWCLSTSVVFVLVKM